MSQRLVRASLLVYRGTVRLSGASLVARSLHLSIPPALADSLEEGFSGARREVHAVFPLVARANSAHEERWGIAYTNVYSSPTCILGICVLPPFFYSLLEAWRAISTLWAGHMVRF